MQNNLTKNLIILDRLILEANAGVKHTDNIAIRVCKDDVIVAYEMKAYEDESQP